MMWKKWSLALALLGSVAQAQTVDAIKKSGEITLGHGENNIPFSYVVAGKTAPQGFAHDIELGVVKYLQEKLAIPEIKIKYQPVGLIDVVEKVNRGGVQLHCATTANFEERQKDLNFSNAFFVATTRILVRKDSEFDSLKSLKGHAVAGFNGTWSLDFAKSRKGQLGLKEVIGFEGPAEVAEALKNGTVQGVFMSDAILAGVMALLDNPDEWHIVGKGAGSQRYGCVMNKNDAQFKALVDEALGKMYSSGEIYTLYDKWFKQPIEPSDKVLNFEMPEATKQVYIAPTDKAIGQN